MSDESAKCIRHHRCKMLMEKWVKHFDDQSDLLTRLIKFIDICKLLSIESDEKNWWRACGSTIILIVFSKPNDEQFFLMKCFREFTLKKFYHQLGSSLISWQQLESHASRIENFQCHEIVFVFSTHIVNRQQLTIYLANGKFENTWKS